MSVEVEFNWADDKTQIRVDRQPPELGGVTEIVLAAVAPFERDLAAALARVGVLEAALKETVGVIDEYYFYNSTCHCNACAEVRAINERARAALEAQP